jgi:transcriptional regulator with XRE-family HTH domain
MLSVLEVLRRDAGLTQAELATRAKVARSTVTSIELGHRPSGATLTRIASALGDALGREVVPETLTEPDILIDPELAPLVYRVGQLLRWLPFDYPSDGVWEALTPPGMSSPDYLHGKWHYIVSALAFDDSRRVYADIGAEMRYILLFLRPTPRLIEALTESFHCQNPDIARRWCDDLLASAWRVWTATQSEAPF